MTRKIQLIFASFAITLILFGALLGFMLVDLSSERYMPGRFGPFFQISAIGQEGVTFSWQGEEYLLERAPVDQVLAALYPYRGFFPIGPQVIHGAVQLLDAYYEPIW